MKSKIPVRVLVLLLFLSASCFADESEVITIIGTGDMGDSLGPLFANHGYKVIYGSRTPDSDRAKALVETTGNGASVMSQIEAAQAGDIILLAVGWPAMEKAAQNLGNLDGKIIIDVSMPWRQNADGYPEISVATSSAELIQSWHPGAKVVKTLASAGALLFDDVTYAGGPVTMPLASDHPDAKQRVGTIIAAMGMDPVDFGPLRMARQIEALQVIWMIPVVQRRSVGWEFYFRRHQRNCEWIHSDWIESAYDVDNLVLLPETQITPQVCP